LTVPVGLIPPLVADYLQGIEDRIALLENPQGPTPLFASTTADMPDPAAFVGCVLRNTTLNILAVSDGANWIRQDTGGAI
jgi:hypothetical protein